MKRNTKHGKLKSGKPRKRSAPKAGRLMVPVYALTSGLVAWIEQALGCTSSPANCLFEDDDWSFVIKMHAFVEAALNHLIMTKLDNPALSQIIPQLTINGLIGKLALIRAYKLLPEESCMVVSSLARLRNRAVHDVQNINLNLRKYVKALDGNKIKDWRTGMTCWHKSVAGSVLEEERDLTMTHPRLAIFSCTCWLMANAYLKTLKVKRFQQRLRNFGQVFFFEQQSNRPRKAAPNQQSSDSEGVSRPPFRPDELFGMRLREGFPRKAR